jgi:hypothetical protein
VPSAAPTGPSRAVNPPCTNSGTTPGASTPGMPSEVCARAGEVKNATKTASREIRSISAGNPLGLQVMASSLWRRDTVVLILCEP